MDFESVKKSFGSIIEKIKNDMPYGTQLWNEQDIKTPKDLFITLNEIFKREEKQLYELNYENKVISASQVLAEHMLKYIPIDESNIDSYKELMSRRYFAYVSLAKIDGIDEYIGPYKILFRILYLGLADFCLNRFDCFAANEESIELLCVKYPVEVEDFTEEEKNRIADALYRHVSKAGTPNDRGYAFNGISLIEDFIKYIPEDILLRMLKQYYLYDIIIKEVKRHQICSVIIRSQLEESKKKHYKFFFLDSLLIADTINRMWGRENKKWEKSYLEMDTLMEKTEFEAFVDPKVNWENDIRQTIRVCHVEGEQLAVQRRRETIEVSYRRGTVTFEFWKERWLLDEYKSRETQEKLSKLLFSKRLEPGNRLLFSLAFFENYRGIKQQNIEFDHHYSFVVEDKKKILRKNDPIGIDHFYGKNIYSMTCIVGKNGTGKSSVVDFLRNTFFELLELIDNSKETICENGVVRRDFEHCEDILDKKTDFFIVFNMGNRDYYLTNMKDIDVEGNDVYPYDCSAYSSLDELSKIIYFSEQIRGEKLGVLQSGDSAENKRSEQRQVDMSEEKMLIKRINAMSMEKESQKQNGYINSDLCYQFAMIKYMDNARLYECLDIDSSENLRVFDSRNKQVLFEKIDHENRNMIQKKVINNPGAYIGALSAGQYAKFSFMARLFWYLEGCRKEKNFYKEYLKLENVIYEKEMLKDGEAVVIFIDEGELYYHPEWQRRYLSMVFEMIQNIPYDVKIQLILTTNSPFMISDVLQNDVQYLSKDGKQRNSEKTLGQNIHALLKDNCFMDFTIGEYSRKLISDIVDQLIDVQNNKEESKKKDSQDQSLDVQNNKEESKKKGSQDHEKRIKEWLTNFYGSENRRSTYEKMVLLISQIGEPVYQQKLTQLLEQTFHKNNQIEERIRQLEQQREKIEMQLMLLREEAQENG